jgi:diguanylate cyclase (GGDEF)-like protein
MKLKKIRNSEIAAFCGISFVAVSYLIFRTGLPKTPLIFFYNLIIIISIQSLGMNRGKFFFGGAVFLTLLISVSSNFFYALNIPVFFAVFFIVDSRIKKFNYYTRIIETRMDEISENTNVLTDEYGKHVKESGVLEKKEQRYKSLEDAASILNSTLSLEKVMEYLIDAVLRIIGKSEAALLFLVDTKEQGLNLVLSRLSGSSVKVTAKKGDLLDEWVFKQRKAFFTGDIRKDFRFNEEKMKECPRDFCSVISCPLVVEKKVMGILRLEHSRPHNYTSEDLRLLDILCDLGAVSIENAMLYKQTMDLAIRDGLTGLFLRRYFMERLKKEIARSLRSGLAFSLFMIDIDNFKNYNDLYGHIAGDIVLKAISKVLLRFGEDGIIARYGGEEFSMLLPETSKEEAKKTAEDIRNAVKKEIIELRRVKTHVTVSIGAASFPEDAKVEDDLILKADNRLYKAKREGRDRVCC